MRKEFRRLTWSFIAVTAATPAYALSELSSQSLINGIVGTLVYGAIGIIMAAIGFKVIDLITPGDLSKDIAEGENIALAVLAAGLMLGICIIIAAAVHG